MRESWQDRLETTSITLFNCTPLFQQFEDCFGLLPTALCQSLSKATNDQYSWQITEGLITIRRGIQKFETVFSWNMHSRRVEINLTKVELDDLLDRALKRDVYQKVIETLQLSDDLFEKKDMVEKDRVSGTKFLRRF